MVGLTLSAAAATERTGGAPLPLAILPQVVLRRSAYCDSGVAWKDLSPFSPVASLAPSAFTGGPPRTQSFFCDTGKPWLNSGNSPKRSANTGRQSSTTRKTT